MRILLVEDDELIAEPLIKALSEQHYVIDAATDGQAGWELVETYTYDLILLDVMLPQLDGISLCRRLRSQGNRTPVLLLTAQDTSTNKVMGLDAGADDYLAKPFDFQELLARIRALLRRGSSALPPTLEWGDLRLDPSTCEVTYEHQPLHLTPKEYGLLELFLRNCHRVYSCGAILDHLWSFEEPPGEDTVRAHIKGLRQKLKAAGVLEDPVETVYGIGYRLRSLEQPEGKDKKSKGKKAPLTSSSNSLIAQSSQNADPHESASLAHDLDQQTLPKISEVWERVKEKFKHRVTLVEQAAIALQQNTLGEELREQAEQEAHKLAGSLGMFGFAEGSRIAQTMEHLLQAGPPLKQDQILHLSQLAVALHQELQQTPDQQIPELLSVDAWPLLMIISQDQQLVEALVAEATTWGVRSAIAPDPITAKQQMASDRPDAVLLDFSAGTTADHLTWLTSLSTSMHPIPVLVLATQDRLLDRVKVARLGGHGFLQKPLSPAQILEAVTQALQRFHTTEARVLIVDDDPQVLMALHSLLTPWGMRLLTLDHPARFWDVLEAFSPDLLILDVEMPDISGIELCQVIRNDWLWNSLPILFLTVHTDANTMHQVFAAGADDYVSKPIVGPELVARILNRLERSRLLRAMAETDALTKVANRRKSIQTLTQFMRLADRHQQPLCFAILDIDHLKQINDQHGHAVGDTVLAHLGQLLRQTFQCEDVVARWGGEEFVIGMYGMTCSEGVGRLTEVLKTLHQKNLIANNHRFQATFSAGVVQYPQDGTDLQTLYRAADMALHQAKIAGGDRIQTGR